MRRILAGGGLNYILGCARVYTSGVVVLMKRGEKGEVEVKTTFRIKLFFGLIEIEKSSSSSKKKN